MALEKELQDAMEREARWDGDADAMWARVAQAIEGDGAEPGPKGHRAPAWWPLAWRVPTWRVPAWRLPAWGAAAAAVILAAGMWAMGPGLWGKGPANTAEPLAVPGVQQPAPTAPESPRREPYDPYPGMKVPSYGATAGRAHIFQGFGIEVSQEPFQPGEPVLIHVRLLGGTEGPVTVLEDPVLLIVPLSAPYDELHPDSARSSAVAELTVPGVAGKILTGMNAEVAVDVTWNPAGAPAGGYRVVLAPLRTQLGEHVSQMGGEGTQIQIAAPAGQ
jgi:hypothetical protein